MDDEKKTLKALEEAINAYAKAAGWTGVITGWTVLVASVEHDGEQDRSGVSTIYPDGGLPWPMALGMLDAAQLRARQAYLSDEP